MREGVALRSHLTVVRVKRKSRKKVLDGPEHWQGVNKVMPLPNLRGDGTSAHFADFMEISTIASNRLPCKSRVAQLSAEGRVLMQERIVFHLTRYAPHLDNIAAATKPVEVEAQMQADFAQAGCLARAGEDIETVEQFEAEFQKYLGAGSDPESLRSQLSDARQSDAVRSIQREIYRLFPRSDST